MRNSHRGGEKIMKTMGSKKKTLGLKQLPQAGRSTGSKSKAPYNSRSQRSEKAEGHDQRLLDFPQQNESKDWENLAELVRSARIQLGLSQGSLAKLLGYSSPQFISNMERGLCSLPVEKLKKLMNILKIAPEDLVTCIIRDQDRAHSRKIGTLSRELLGLKKKY